MKTDLLLYATVHLIPEIGEIVTSTFYFAAEFDCYVQLYTLLVLVLVLPLLTMMMMILWRDFLVFLSMVQFILIFINTQAVCCGRGIIWLVSRLSVLSSYSIVCEWHSSWRCVCALFCFVSMYLVLRLPYLFHLACRWLLCLSIVYII